MRTQLTIKWETAEPGVRGRLSLAAFHEPLGLLLRAYQRIASGVLTDALEDSEYGMRGGRYHAEAKYVDLELVAVHEGSTVLDLDCVARTPPGATIDAFNDLPDRAMMTLVESIKDESSGVPRNAMVRNFLRSLNGHVVSQRYSIFTDGEQRLSVDVGKTNLVEQVAIESPNLLEVHGAVIGVTFEPAAPEVRLRAGGSTLSCAASARLVEQALHLRGENVRGMVLTDKHYRLLWLRRDEDQPLPDAEARSRRLFARWDKVLRRLAQ